jgi:hypothetical protein
MLFFNYSNFNYRLPSSQSSTLSNVSTISILTNSTGKKSQVMEYHNNYSNNSSRNDNFSNKLIRIVNENQSNVNQSCIGNMIRKKKIVNGEIKYLYGKEANLNIYNTLRQLENEIFENRYKNNTITPMETFKL